MLPIGAFLGRKEGRYCCGTLHASAGDNDISGSLWWRIASNTTVASHLMKISWPFNKQVDFMVIDMWKRGKNRAFLKMLPQGARDCDGKGGMRDTAMLFGLLCRDSYTGCAGGLTEYFKIPVPAGAKCCSPSPD